MGRAPRVDEAGGIYHALNRGTAKGVQLVAGDKQNSITGAQEVETHLGRMPAIGLSGIAFGMR